jgi:di/tricarboxylate transporter
VERNTVWRDMVAMERRTVAATVGAPTTTAGQKRAWLQANRKLLSVLLSVAAFATVLFLEPFREPEKTNCAGMLVFASMLWATEAIPLFATALLVPFLATVLRVMVDDHDPHHPVRMNTQDAANAIFHCMFSQVRWRGVCMFYECSLRWERRGVK